MRLPAKLLGQVRVGVGVGAVLLGGCDLADEASERVLGETVAIEVGGLEAASAEAAPAPTPEPMLLTRGVSGVVGESITRVESTSRPAPPPIPDFGPTPAPTPTEEVEPFVPYDGGTGLVATAPPTLGGPKAKPRARPRSKPKAIAPIDEPCDPGVGAIGTAPPKAGWECLACGRG